MSSPCKIAVVGAGLIGRRHADLLAANALVKGGPEKGGPEKGGSEKIAPENGAPDCALHAIVEPRPEGRRYAAELGAQWFASLGELLASDPPDGAIIATPNQVHVQNAMECINAGCPVLVEKPIAPAAADAEELARTATARGVPLLVGYHRRHNPLIRQAKELIESGELGDIAAVHGTFWLRKPLSEDDYFAPAWRRQPGGGPVMVNATHDFDLLRHLCGEIIAVHAFSSNRIRRFEVEDSAAAIIQFASGALGTFSLSDAVAAPWSWEMTAGENPDFTSTRESCYLIGGTRASLSIPDLRLWRHKDGGYWKDPIAAAVFPRSTPRRSAAPLAAQLAHFANVIRGLEAPLVSGEEALQSLRVVEAFQQSARTGETVRLPDAASDSRNGNRASNRKSNPAKRKPPCAATQ